MIENKTHSLQPYTLIEGQIYFWKIAAGAWSITVVTGNTERNFGPIGYFF